MDEDEHKKSFVEPGMDGPHGWIQWKNTEVCIDIHCACGAFMHYDGGDFYHMKCGHCNQVYQVGQNVTLYPIDVEPSRTKTIVDDDSSNYSNSDGLNGAFGQLGSW